MQKSQALMTVNWDDQDMQTQIKAQIKNTFGSELTPVEWNLFVAVGKMTGLNPILKEIWAVKYGKAPAQIFIGRDGYRKSAQVHAQYDYHVKSAVYENDKFRYENGEVYHEPNLANPGKLKFAYCIVKRKNSSRPNYTRVFLEEYYAGNKNPDGTVKTKKYQDFQTKQWKEKEMGPTLWDTKPATMLEKVAEAQGLRMTFQELFAGTYDESEGDSMDNVAPGENTYRPSEALRLQKTINDAKSLVELKGAQAEFIRAYEKGYINLQETDKLKGDFAAKRKTLEAEKIFDSKLEDVKPEEKMEAIDGEIVEDGWNKEENATGGTRLAHGEKDPCDDKHCPIHGTI